MMQFEINQKSFMSSLQFIANIVSERQTIPILANVLLETMGDQSIRLSATDLKVSVQCEAAAKVGQEGSITIPAKRLLQIIKELPDMPLSITIDDKHHVSIDCGKSNFKIIGLPKEEFPPIVFFEDTPLTLPQKELKEMLKQTYISVSSDTTRHILNGVLFKMDGAQLITVATDGRRLSRVIRKMEHLSPIDAFQFILPGKMAQELLRVLKDDGDVEMMVNDKEVMFKIGSISYMSQLIDGKYPNYEQVIPDSVKHMVVLDRIEFQSAIRRASVLVDQKLNRIKVEMKPHVLEISTKTPELGESVEEIEVNYDGAPISVGFAPNFILDGLKVMTEDVVTLGLTEEGRAGLVKGDDRFLYVIMPMRLV